MYLSLIWFSFTWYVTDLRLLLHRSYASCLSSMLWYCLPPKAQCLSFIQFSDVCGLTRYVKLRVAHAPGIRERFPRHRFQKKPRVSDTGMQHGTCVMAPDKASVVPLPAKTEAESHSHSSIWHYISPHNEAIKRSSSVPPHSNKQLTQTGKVPARQLAGREVTCTWNEQQKLPRQKNEMKKSENAQGVHTYVLQNCKTWGGPRVSVDDLGQVLLKAPEEAFCVT